MLGRWLPLAPLLALAKAQGALTVVDGAQGAVHGRPDMQALGCDFYVFSAHKLYGPDGVGVLYGRPKALARLSHWQFGGEMVQHCDYQHARFRPAPLGFEAGTPPIAGVIGLGLYLFSPVDLIPDILPLLGLADDLVLVPLALHWLLSRLPAEVLQEARRRAAGQPAGDARHPGRPPLVKRVD